jgi:hypothetical protein
LEQRCVRQFPRVALMRGRDYFRSGFVSDVSQMGDAFSLTVQGRGERYNVWIDFSKAAANNSIEARCTCPFYAGGGLCKHLWASVIKLERSGLSEKVPGVGPLQVLHEGGRPPRRSHHQNNGGGHAQTPAAPRLAYTGAGGWLDRLEQIQGKRGLKTAGQPGGQMGHQIGGMTAAFVISAVDTISSGKLTLDFWARRRGPGGDGPLRPGRTSDRDFQLLADAPDQELISLLMRTGNPKNVASFGSQCTRFTVDPLLENQLLTTLTAGGKAFLSRSPNGSPDNADRPLRMDRGKPWEVELRVEATGSAYRLDATLKRDDETKSITDPVCVLQSGFLLFGEKVGRLAEARHASWLLNLRLGEFVVPQEQGDILLRRILTDPTSPRLTWPDDMGWKRSLIEPRPRGVFRPLGNDPSTGRMSMTVSFDYEGREVSLADDSDSLIDVEKQQVYPRNRALEEEALTQALEVLRDPTGTIPSNDLPRAATELSESGWTIYVENRRVVVADDFALNVSSNTDWFEVNLSASFGGDKLRQAEILAALEAKSSVV